MLPPTDAAAPLALGGAPAGDPYLLPTLMASTILASEGFSERNLGPECPTTVLVEAARRYRPSLIWLSRSVDARTPRELARDLETLAETARPWDGVVVIGGRATGDLPRLPDDVHHLRSMAELAAFAKGLRARS
jgi:hypothetical protein